MRFNRDPYFWHLAGLGAISILALFLLVNSARGQQQTIATNAAPVILLHSTVTDSAQAETLVTTKTDGTKVQTIELTEEQTWLMVIIMGLVIAIVFVLTVSVLE